MNSLRWRLCLLLWFMYAGVECWPKLKLLSRNDDDGPRTLTIGYIVDDSLASLDKRTVKNWIQLITTYTEHELYNWFNFQIKLRSRIKYSEEVPVLMSRMKSNKNTHFIYLDGAIKTLTDYYKDTKHPDIICLLTNYTISDGGMVTKAHGEFILITIC
uniref:Putative vegetative cell wall protein gp1 n=1 Tax=Ixodes ricinus TaxID=34613 RepID=A0A6B0UXX5_IXORI